MNLIRYIALVSAVFCVACAEPSPHGGVANVAPQCRDGGAAKLLAGIQEYNSGQFERAFVDLKVAADCGNSDGQVNLGYMYARGQATPVDQAEALRLYALSAAQGNAEAMNAIGYKYNFGTGVAVDLGKAIEWTCKAVRLGNPRALNNLGLDYAQGRGVPKDISVAQDLWQQSIDRGHASAMVNLGASLLHSEDAEQRRKGEALIYKAAKTGNSVAQDMLRRNGFTGALPPPRNEAAMMFRTVPEPPGHAPACDAISSLFSRPSSS